MMKTRGMTNRRRIAALDFDSLKLKVSGGIILIRNMKRINCFRFVNYFRVYISFGRRSVLEVHD